MVFLFIPVILLFFNWCSHKYDFLQRDYVNLVTKTKGKKQKEKKTTTTTVTRKVHYVKKKD